MYIDNTIEQVLTYKIDWKVLQLKPWINLVDWYNEKFIMNLLNTAFFLKISDYESFMKQKEDEEEKIQKTQLKWLTPNIVILDDVLPDNISDLVWDIKVSDLGEKYTEVISNNDNEPHKLDKLKDLINEEEQNNQTQDNTVDLEDLSVREIKLLLDEKKIPYNPNNNNKVSLIKLFNNN